MTDPTLVAPYRAGGSERQPLSSEQVQRWRDEGYVFVDELLPADLIEAVMRFGAERFPAPGTPESFDMRNFGSSVVFPTLNAAFDAVTLHPRILDAVSQLLDRPVADLRLTQSDLWPKYGRAQPDGPAEDLYDNNDQRIHVDYPNHMLTHPTPWDRPSAVEIIIYYSDRSACGGPTAVVPRQGADDPLYPWPILGAPGIGDLRWVNDRATAESYLAEHRPDLVEFRQQLYDREVHTDFRPGAVLLYRHDVWHRGTPLRTGPTMRLAQNLTIRLAEAEWISTVHRGWSWTMYKPDHYFERFIAQADVDQRAVLGFPPPGASYWCEATVDAVEARFGPFGFDPAPYRLALT
ncbi:MAG: hypothetical protein AAFN30_19040 [Actinomycetota bacterium]